MEPQRGPLSGGDPGWRNRGGQLRAQQQKIGAAGAALEETLPMTSGLPRLSCQKPGAAMNDRGDE